ncbi:MAG: class I SAM-dependent methyltransferase [Bacteroidales bacterium]
MKKGKLYPESKVELTPFLARNYDMLLKMASLGRYGSFLKKAIQAMELQSGMQVLDLGCGSGHNASFMLSYLGEEGRLVGIDISPEMEQQFRRRFMNDQRVSFVNQRIDVAFDLGQRFDVVFMSFVLHGFPHEVRATILENVSRHLKPGGYFLLLDFAEFDMQAMPRLHHWIFTHVECVYAFDFVGRNWKEILVEKGFGHTKETFYLKNYVRLLKAQKL